MKKIAMVCIGLVFASVMSFAQERKPVIGLAEITFEKDFQVIQQGWDKITLRDSEGRVTGNIPAEKYPTIESVAPQVRAAFSSAIVSSKRFAVIERTAEQLDKIRLENLETSGEMISNTPLDFLLTGSIVEYQAVREQGGGFFSSSSSTTKRFRLGVAVQFTDVQSGRIVISETFTKEVEDDTASPNDCARELANELIAKVVTNLYPPTVLSVTKQNNIVQIPNASYKQGDVIEIYSIGDAIVDPYTGQSLGHEENFVAYFVVIEINGNLAKAAPDPKGDYKDAEVERGMRVRGKIDPKKDKIENDKRAIRNLKRAKIIK